MTPWRRECHRRSRRRLVDLLAGTAMVFFASCQQEARELHPDPASAALSSGVSVGELRPGSLPPRMSATLGQYQENAYAMNEGKRLYDSYNCSGCHAHGGGAIGPALMDDRWIYGSAPANVFATIVEGRPNGMPSFRGKIPDFQVAQLVAFVRSMAGLAGKAAAPGRDDHMSVKSPENTLDPQPELREQGTSLQ